MIPAKVVDASAIGAVLFDEPQQAEIQDRLRDARLIAPPLLAFEIANVCLKMMRRYPDRRDRLLAAFDVLATMPIEIVEVEHQGALLLAVETGLSAYDSSYLWLSRRYGAELVTLDRRLEAATNR